MSTYVHDVHVYTTGVCERENIYIVNITVKNEIYTLQRRYRSFSGIILDYPGHVLDNKVDPKFQQGGPRVDLGWTGALDNV